MPKNYFFFVLLISCLLSFQASAQRKEFIYSKEGKPVLNRKQMINNCLKGMNKDRNNNTALSICECQVDKIDWHFTSKQFRENTRLGIIEIGDLIKSDSILDKQINECFTNSGVTLLLQAEGFEKDLLTIVRLTYRRAPNEISTLKK